jgi:hypothetical protein
MRIDGFLGGRGAAGVSGYANGGAGGWTSQFSTGVDAWPTPQIFTRPPAPVQPQQWTAPALHATGGFAVRPDGLHSAASVIRPSLAPVRSWTARVESHQASFRSLMTWPGGLGAGSTLVASAGAFAAAATDAHDAHAHAAGSLKASADAYADAEHRSGMAVRSGGASGSGGGGSAPASAAFAPRDGAYLIQKGIIAPDGVLLGFHQIMSILHGLNPAEVTALSRDCTGLARSLDDVLAMVQSAASLLAVSGTWEGAAAGAAMSYFQTTFNQAAKLSAQARTAAGTMAWLGGDVLPRFQEIPVPAVASGTEQGVSSTLHQWLGGNAVNGRAAADSAAQDYIKTLNGHLATANEAMPGEAATPRGGSAGSRKWASSPGNHARSGGSTGTVPGPGYTSVRSPASSGGGGGVPGSLASAGGGSVPAYSPLPGAGSYAPGKLPSGGAGPAGSLQGYEAPSGGGGAGSFALGPSGPGVGGGGSVPRVPVVPGPGFGPVNPGPKPPEPLHDVVPPENVPPGSPAAAGAAAGEARAGAAGAEGSSGMPMGGMGGGGGEQDKERQREAWMFEDKNIWGAPEGFTGPIIE